jgi:hypothetical protein
VPCPYGQCAAQSSSTRDATCHVHACREEHHCRFCDARYPDWRPALTPPELRMAGLTAEAASLPAAAEPELQAAPATASQAAFTSAAQPALSPVMAIYFNGKLSQTLQLSRSVIRPV